MKRNRLLKIVACPLLSGLLLAPTVISGYLVYRVNQLEQAVVDMRENSDKAQLQVSEAEEIAAGSGNASAETNNLLNRETELSLKEDVDSLENQLSWDIAKTSAEAWDSNEGMHKVYLTFDDGPSRNTDKILDILNEYGVKATFFVVGKDGFEEQYQRIVAEGHTLGMHSYSHKYQEIYQSLDSYVKDLNQIQSYLYEMTGENSTIVRFPGGSSNSVSHVDMHELISYLNQHGLTYYDWNISSADAGKGYISASQIVSNVMNNVRKYDSAVILMHDSADRNSTVEALPTIIEKILESENTVLLPISDDTVPIQHIQ